ncbi:PIN domain-containing protein [Agromyces kandeliae]|uniref:PIN domain-containing protein n=1 Tax=Agromyces kandeliae TaxID=2666141 RepID=A0A6L5QYY5_9MICO|nr:PIN domain-containing protein [Agromyces kandeliae]MRX42971.1 PIN domain-containing protein [Agromyces kandeliae]
MALFTAFLDACVLVPIAPCDTMLRMADSGAFRPLWSRRVVDEALRALERIHPDIDPSRFQSRFRSMDEAFDDALVEGWEALEGGIELPDPDDRHVVAAAIRGRADVIVTENVSDFPEAALRPFGLAAIRLDDFLLDQFDLGPSATCQVITEQAAAMTHPPVAAEVLLARLARSGAPKFAEAVSEMLADNDLG